DAEKMYPYSPRAAEERHELCDDVVERFVRAIQVEGVGDEIRELRLQHTAAMNQPCQYACGERSAAEAEDEDCVALAERPHEVCIESRHVVEQAVARHVAGKLGGPSRGGRERRPGGHRPDTGVIVDDLPDLLLRSVLPRDREEPDN